MYNCSLYVNFAANIFKSVEFFVISSILFGMRRTVSPSLTFIIFIVNPKVSVIAHCKYSCTSFAQWSPVRCLYICFGGVAVWRWSATLVVGTLCKYRIRTEVNNKLNPGSSHRYVQTRTRTYLVTVNVIKSLTWTPHRVYATLNTFLPHHLASHSHSLIIIYPSSHLILIQTPISH